MTAKLLRSTCWLALVMGLAACAPSRHLITLAPQTPAATSQASGVHSISVHVADGRESATIGKRGDAVLYTEQDVPALLHKTVSDGLAQRGFTVGAAPGSNNLFLTLSSLTFEAGGGKWVAKTEVSARAVRSGGEYKANYRIERDKQAVLTPGAKESEEIINEALSAVLSKLFNDQDLLTFLSQ